MPGLRWGPPTESEFFCRWRRLWGFVHQDRPRTRHPRHKPVHHPWELEERETIEGDSPSYLSRKNTTAMAVIWLWRDPTRHLSPCYFPWARSPGTLQHWACLLGTQPQNFRPGESHPMYAPGAEVSLYRPSFARRPWTKTRAWRRFSTVKDISKRACRSCSSY